MIGERESSGKVVQGPWRPTAAGLLVNMLSMPQLSNQREMLALNPEYERTHNTLAIERQTQAIKRATPWIGGACALLSLFLAYRFLKRS